MYSSQARIEGSALTLLARAATTQRVLGAAAARGWSWPSRATLATFQASGSRTTAPRTAGTRAASSKAFPCSGLDWGLALLGNWAQVSCAPDAGAFGLKDAKTCCFQNAAVLSTWEGARGRAATRRSRVAAPAAGARSRLAEGRRPVWDEAFSFKRDILGREFGASVA